MAAFQKLLIVKKKDEEDTIEISSPSADVAKKSKKPTPNSARTAKSPAKAATPSAVPVSKKAKIATPVDDNTSDSEDIDSNDDGVQLIQESKFSYDEEGNEMSELSNASFEKNQKKETNIAKSSKKSKEESESYYHDKFLNLVGRERGLSLLKAYKSIGEDEADLSNIELMEQQNAFIIRIYEEFPDMPTRCFLNLFGIGSNRLARFVKQGIKERKKPGGLNGREVTKEMKKDLIDYVNSLRMEEVSIAPGITRLKLLDETTLAKLHEHYKEYYKNKNPELKVIEKYKTFYEHFNKLFPDVQLNKGKGVKTNKKSSGFEMDEDD